MNGLEEVSFKIIAAVGTARSMYIQAIQEAKLGNVAKSNEMIESANDFFLEGHRAHATLIQAEANGEKTELSLLLMHAEDQMMSAEMMKIMALEFVELYSREGEKNEEN